VSANNSTIKAQSRCSNWAGCSLIRIDYASECVRADKHAYTSLIFEGRASLSTLFEKHWTPKKFYTVGF